MARRLRHPLVALAAVVALTVPWLALRGVGLVGTLPTTAVILTSGVAVVGAAFVLTWGAETAEVDVPRSFALAVLAIIAVAPEYAVDALYAWEAGTAPGTQASETAANLAVANMTGANRILVGLGWSSVALYAVYRAKTGSERSRAEAASSRTRSNWSRVSASRSCFSGRRRCTPSSSPSAAGSTRSTRSCW